MQSTQDGTGEYVTNGLDGARNRRVLVQGQVRACLIVVIQIRPQQMTEMALTKDNHVVNTLPPDRPDQPLRIAVLPRRPRGCGAMLRDNQGEKGATIRMRMAPGLTDEGRA